MSDAVAYLVSRIETLAVEISNLSKKNNNTYQDLRLELEDMKQCNKNQIEIINSHYRNINALEKELVAEKTISKILWDELDYHAKRANTLSKDNDLLSNELDEKRTKCKTLSDEELQSKFDKLTLELNNVNAELVFAKECNDKQCKTIDSYQEQCMRMSNDNIALKDKNTKIFLELNKIQSAGSNKSYVYELQEKCSALREQNANRLQREEYLCKELSELDKSFDKVNKDNVSLLMSLNDNEEKYNTLFKDSESMIKSLTDDLRNQTAYSKNQEIIIDLLKKKVRTTVIGAYDGLQDYIKNVFSIHEHAFCKKIIVAKYIRDELECSLEEAKDMVDEYIATHEVKV